MCFLRAVFLLLLFLCMFEIYPLGVFVLVQSEQDDMQLPLIHLFSSGGRRWVQWIKLLQPSQ